MLIQIGVLVALYVSVRNSISRIEAVAAEVRTKVGPVIETAKAMVAEIKPNITTIVSNVTESTDRVRSQSARVDPFAGEVRSGASEVHSERRIYEPDQGSYRRD